jgi:adenylate cyclase
MDLFRVAVAESDGERSLTSAGPTRLAVLPFTNMSPDPTDEIFADGMTEEVITELSKLPGLRLIARTSVMRFKRDGRGISEIGRELNVGTILEGSVLHPRIGGSKGTKSSIRCCQRGPRRRP